MSVDSSLLIEGLLADIAVFSVCELLVGFELKARHVLYIGDCIDRGSTLLNMHWLSNQNGFS